MTEVSPLAVATMILHIAPSHVDIRPGQGSHKDVAARRAFFTATGVNYRYANVSDDDPLQLDDILRSSRPSHVLIEYSYFPKVAKEIRRRFPDAYIAVRSHNIEPLQHWTLAERDTPGRHLRRVYAFLRLLICDARIAHIADHIFVISWVEAHRYWRWLGVGPKVSWLPYVPPPVLRESTGDNDRDVIACLPGGARSRRTIDLVNRFARFAQAAKDAGWSQRFVMTGDITGWDVKLTPAVEQAGYVDDLQSFYRYVQAVAILSPIGYGFKTTIADAIWSGAMVLVHPTIGASLPEELKPHCLIVDAVSEAELARVRLALGLPPPDAAGPNAVTRRFNQEMARFMRGKAYSQAAEIDRRRP